MENQYNFNTIKKAIHFISANYHHQPGLDEIAAAVKLSKFHFQRMFQQWAGITPKSFLQYITIEHAKKSLLNGQSTLETAYEVGLSGNGRLHDLFIKLEACTPGEFKKRGRGICLYYDVIETPFGPALIAETAKGICRLSFLEDTDDPVELLKREYPDADFVKGIKEHGRVAKKYFSDWQVPRQNIMLDLKGTPFQVKVWKSLLSIPSANLLSYQGIASRIGSPKAARSVGAAIGKNPVAYLIPCHRVIKQSGVIGEYRWGSDRKTAIIGYENCRLNSNLAL